MNYSDALLLTFAITAAYDVVLQLARLGLPMAAPVEWLVGDSDWYRSLLDNKSSTCVDTQVADLATA